MVPGTWTRRVVAGATIIFALWFRLEYQSTTMDDMQLQAEAGQYIQSATNLLQNFTISAASPDAATPTSTPYSTSSPGYSALVAFAMLLGGDQHWQRYLLYIQAGLGALSVALTISIACRWLSFAYAISAGLLVAVWPHMVTLSSNVLPETLFGFILLLGVYFLCRAWPSRQRIGYVLAGFSFSFAALINPAILPLPIFIGVYLLFSRRKQALLFLVCTLVLPLAWGVHGLTQDAQKSASGRLMENVLLGMDPDFSYSDTPAAVAARARFHVDMESFQLGQFGDMKTLLDRLAEKPQAYAKWYFLQKPMRFWQWSIVHGYGEMYVYPALFPAFKIHPLFLAIASVCYSLNVWLFAGAIFSIVLLAPRCARGNLQDKDTPLVLIALLFVYATLLHIVLIPDARYATPFRPFEILLAVALVALAQQYWLAKKTAGKLQGA